MELKSVLKITNKVAAQYLIDEPYIVGGIPRDVSMGIEIKTDDVDITTNTPDSTRLGILLADNLSASFRLFDDSHVSVYFDDFALDFSSNFISEKVVEHLGSDTDSRLYEPYSRDFTINTLGQSLETREIHDPLGAGLKDIEEKMIRTPVPPEITLTDDPRRIFRAVNLAARYGFDIDESIKEFVRVNRDIFSGEEIKEGFVVSKMSKAIDVDPERTLSLLIEMNILDMVPLVGKFKDLIISEKLLLRYLGE